MNAPLPGNEERVFRVENVNISEADRRPEEPPSAGVVTGAAILMSIFLGLCCAAKFLLL